MALKLAHCVRFIFQHFNISPYSAKSTVATSHYMGSYTDMVVYGYSIPSYIGVQTLPMFGEAIWRDFIFILCY